MSGTMLSAAGSRAETGGAVKFRRRAARGEGKRRPRRRGLGEEFLKPVR